MRTLLEAMRLAGQCHLAWLDPEKGNGIAGGYEIAHDTGRWWDAMLRLESAAGISIPPDAETAMYENLRLLTDNPIGVLMNRPDISWMNHDAVFNPHNFRETLLALVALIRHRNSGWAAEKGRQVVGALDRFLRPDGRLDIQRLAHAAGRPPGEDTRPWLDGTATAGRALEAVLLFHQATRDETALCVAHRIARYHYENTLHPDGSPRMELLAPDHVGHNHSYLGTLRGLLLYGRMTGESQYVRAVEATYRNTLWKHNASFSGWTPHDLGIIRFPNGDGDPVGEHGSCGDLVQLAMWLAEEEGNSGFYDDVERLIRARLLPAQVIRPDNPKHHGAWGVYSHPYGYGVMPDVFSAVLHALTDVYGRVAQWNGPVLSIHMHFDVDTPRASIRTRRGRTASITVTPRAHCSLRLRMPGWAPRESVSHSAGGEARWDGGYLVFPSAHAPVTVEYALPESRIEETMPVSGKVYKLKLRGDEVTGCEPQAPLYPAADGKFWFRRHIGCI